MQRGRNKMLKIKKTKGKQRMKNLKVSKKDITNKSLTNFLPSAASLIDNIDVVEENMTLIVNEIAKRENWKID